MRRGRWGSIIAQAIRWAWLGIGLISISGLTHGQVVLGSLTSLNGIDIHPGRNILFTGNGTVGWMSDTSRNRIILFDARSGNVVRTLTGLTSPGSMTLSHDGRTVAVVGIGTNSVTLIDTSTYQTRPIIAFQSASFDVANNFIFSADDRRGFVADYALSNVLYFDIPNANFIRAQALIANAKPGAMALTPDGQLLTVLTTGLRNGIGNYIAILQADTLLPYRTGRLPIPDADFSTANNMLFAPNGTGYVASFGTDVLYAFDPITFTTSTLRVGGGPGALTLSSDANILAVPNANSASVSLVDLRSFRISANVALGRGPLNPLSRVEFSPNGTLGYAALPTTNELIVFKVADGTIAQRLSVPGGPVQLAKNTERGLLFSLNAQGRTVVVAGFVLNFPILKQNPGEFTGFAFSNPGDVPLTMTLTAYSNSGQLFSSRNGPSIRPLTLSPKTQLAKNGADLFNIQTNLEGWVQLTTLDGPAFGFFVQGNASVSYLNGGTGIDKSSTRLAFTRVLEGSRAYGDPATTEIDLVNPGPSSATLNFTLFDATGQSAGTAIRQLPPLNRISTSISALFPSANLPQTGGSVQVTSTVEVAGYEVIRYGNALFMLPARDLSSAPGGPLYAPQFASGLAGDAFFTEINLVNTNTNPVRTTIRLIGDGGQLITGQNLINPVTVNIPGNGAFFGRGSQVFGLPDEMTDTNITVGSLIIETSDSGVLGDVVFGDPIQGRFISSLPMVNGLAFDVVFSQVAEGTVGNQSFITGLAILNPGASDVTITVRVFTEAGRLVGTTDYLLPAGARTARLLREFVPAVLGQLGGFVRLTATGGITAFELFASDVPLQFLASVPAQTLR